MAADERRDRKRRLAVALRVFGLLGFGEGTAGHITARDPEHPDRFWVNPLGTGFRQMTVGDLLLVDAEGTVVEGDGPVNLAAFAIHSRIHAARPEVVAAAHAHSVYGRAWSTIGRTLDPLTQDACAFYDDHVVYDTYTGPVLDPAEGDRIAATLGSNKAVILANHGLLTVGRSVDEAAWWFVSMERTCEIQLAAEGARTEPRPIEADRATATQPLVGAPDVGWRQFQPFHDWIAADHPDVFDE